VSETKHAWTERGMLQDVTEGLDAVKLPAVVVVGDRDQVEHEGAPQGHLRPLFAADEIRGAARHRTSFSTGSTRCAGKRLQRFASRALSCTNVSCWRTLCTVEAEEYLLRRINGVIEPIIERSNHARDAVLEILAEAIPSFALGGFRDSC
jgi:hypothetical protein